MPKIGRFNPPAQSFGRRASSISFGSGQDEAALARLASEVGDEAQDFFEADQSSRVSEASRNAAVEIADLRTEVDKNPDYAAREELFIAGRQTILDTQRGTILSNEFKDRFDRRIFGVSESTRLQVKEGARATQLDQIRARTITTVDTFAQMIAETDDPVLRRQYQIHIDTALQEAEASGAFNAAQIARMKISSAEAQRVAAEVVQSQNAADDLTAQFPNDFPAQIRAAKTRFSGKMRDLVVGRLEDANRLEKEFESAADDARFDAAVRHAQLGKLTQAQAVQLDLPPKQRNAVIRVIKQMETTRAPTEQSDTYWELRRMASNPGRREEFKQTNLNLFAGLVTTDELADRQ